MFPRNISYPVHITWYIIEKMQLVYKILLLSAFVVLTTPRDLSAYPAPGTLPFGGLVSYTIPCTCPGSIGNLWIWFTPLYNGSFFPIGGPLVYIPMTTTLYSWYEIGVAGSWHLGSYMPGVQACWMLMPPPAPGCFAFPSLGVMTQVGTSRLF